MPVHTIFFTKKNGKRVYPKGSAIHWGVGEHDLYGYKAYCGARSRIGFRFTKNAKKMNCQRCLKSILNGYDHAIYTKKLL